MTSGVDSRTILDTVGAEDLLGRGDMLYQPIDAPRAVRLQGVLVTDPEIEAARRALEGARRPAVPTGDHCPATRRQGGRTARRGGRQRRCRSAPQPGDRHRPALRQGVRRLLQRRLRIGYARAARVLDQMEDRGIVGPADGSRFREVLVTPDGWGGDVAPDEDDA